MVTRVRGCGLPFCRGALVTSMPMPAVSALRTSPTGVLLNLTFRQNIKSDLHFFTQHTTPKMGSNLPCKDSAVILQDILSQKP